MSNDAIAAMGAVAIDSTIRATAFLNAVVGAPYFDLLERTYAGEFRFVLPDDILDEMLWILATVNHVKARF